MRDFTKWLVFALAALLAAEDGASAASYLGLKSSDAPAAIGGGAVVAAAAPNSPAMMAGLIPNDIIIGFDGRRIQSAEQLGDAVAARNPGDAASLDVMRFDGQSWRRLAVRVTLAAAPSDAPSAPAASSADPAAPAASAPIAVNGWTRVAEPSQQAFTFEIPQNWRFAAGVPITRATSSIVVSSPDDAVWLKLNDPRLLPLLNFPVNGGVGLPTSVGYVQAPYFIDAFGATLVGEQCQSPKLQRLRLREDIARGIDAAFSVRGGRSIAADAIFACERNGKPSLAFMAIVTHLYPSFGMLQFWQIDLEEIAIAPSDQIAAAIAIMNRSWSSLEWSPTWVQSAQQVALHQTQAAARGLDQTLHDSHLVDNIINGVGDYFNPASGGTIQAPAGFERYCQDGLGIVFGSNGGTIKPNCQQLTPVR